MSRLILLASAAAATFLGSLAMSVFLSALMALPVMWLWNALFFTYPVLGAPLVEVSFFQAWGISILASLLFKRDGK